MDIANGKEDGRHPSEIADSSPVDPTDTDIARGEILGAVESFQIIEAYPEDKYLPSFLLLAKGEKSAFHVLIAVDLEGNNVRIVTAYRPGQEHWLPDLVTRRKLRRIAESAGQT